MPSGRATAPGPAQSQSKAKKGANTATLPRIPLLVDAVTFDEAGRLVRDLTAADFGVSVRGEAKKIVSVNYVNSIAGTIAPVSTTLALTPDRIHRTLVLIADDLGLSADGADNLRRTLTRFLDEQMRPSDMVSILRTASGSGNHQELTSDRSELAAAAAGIHYNPGAGREAAAASGARSALRFALAGLRTVEGRKAVVLFSGNAALWEKPGGDSLTEAADRASAVVTLIDIRGASAAAAPTVGLAELAQHTGGRFATRTDDLAGALAGALRDQDGYYVVGYEPDQTPADGITGKPLPQHPVLTITRQGAQSRARNGLLNSDNFTSDPARSEAWRPSFTTPAADLGRGLSSPFVAGGIPVRLVAVYSLTKSGPQIEGVVHIDARDLTYTHWLDGRVTATLDVQLAAFDENGQSVQSGGGTYNLRLTPDEFKESLTRGFLAMPKLTIRAPGAYQVRVAVRDGTSGRIGSASELVNAADVSNGQLQITGLSLADESAATGNAAVNVFRPGQTFQYAYQIVNLALDANKGSEVDTRTRILHEGAPIFEGANTVLHFAPSEDPRVRTAGAGVKLGAALEPGYYVLEITVTDSLAKQPRTVREYVRFEVRG